MTQNQKQEIARLRSGGMGYVKIARTLGLSENTVKSYCRRTFTTSAEIIKPGAVCKYCGKSISQIPHRKTRLFCSDICRRTYWNENQSRINRKSAITYKCEYCGSEFIDYAHKNRRYCSHPCYIADRYKDGGKGE